jgi:hypothetical protein
MNPTRSEYAVAVDDALARLKVVDDYDDGAGPRPCVHTFVDTPLALLGAHWPLTKVRAAFERWGVEESGEAASAMGHGLVVVERDRQRSVFFATKPPVAA